MHVRLTSRKFINIKQLRSILYLCSCTVVIIKLCNALNIHKLTSNTSYNTLPDNWPGQWNNSVIPYGYNFFSPSPKRLVSLVKKGLKYIEDRSCLTFKELNPKVLSLLRNFTYLYYNYSGVLENCCLPLFFKPQGRRFVLISPLCTLPTEVAHATMHALGLRHNKFQSFPKRDAKMVMFLNTCENFKQKMEIFDKRVGIYSGFLII